MICFVYRPIRKGKRARLYSGRYRIEGMPAEKTVALKTSDKQVAQQKLREIVREAEREAAGIIAPKAQRESAARPLSEHLAELLSDLDGRGETAKYVRELGGTVRRLCAECDWKYPRDVTAESFEAWRAGQTARSARTLNHYLAGAQRLMNWMCERGRIVGNPLGIVGNVETRGREVRKRRALTEDEVRRLLAVAGVRRSLYVMAVYTGLRRSELGKLQWGDVVLDGADCHLRVRSSTTKNRKGAKQPLHPAAVAELTAMQRHGGEPGDAVFPRVWRNREFRQDLARAGIPVVDGQGRVADFHGLRTTLCTYLGKAGVPALHAMKLMRHSSMHLTASVYTDATQLPTAEAVAALPDLRPRDSQIDSQNPDAAGHGVAQAGATGCDGGKSQPVAGQEKGHAESQCDATCPEGGNGSGLPPGVVDSHRVNGSRDQSRFRPFPCGSSPAADLSHQVNSRIQPSWRAGDTPGSEPGSAPSG